MEPKELKEEIAYLEELLAAQNQLHDKITRILRREINSLTYQLQKECKHEDIVVVAPSGFSCWSWEPVKTCQDCGREFNS